jgi:hypothetical protein
MASGCQYPGPDTVMAPIEIHPACEKKGNASGKVLVIPHPIQGEPEGRVAPREVRFFHSQQDTEFQLQQPFVPATDGHGLISKSSEPQQEPNEAKMARGLDLCNDRSPSSKEC